MAAACGSSGGAVTAPNTPKQIAADKKLATQAVLRASDMPTGFKGSPQDNSSNDKIPDAAARKFGSCVHLPEATITEMMNDTQQPGKPSVDAPEFEKGSGLTDVTIDNGVEIDRSSKDLSDPLDKFGATSAIPCWKDLFQAAFDNSKPANATFSGLAMSVLPLARIGDQQAAFAAKVTVGSEGLSIAAYLDLYFVRRGRAGVTLMAIGIGKPVSRSLEKSLLQTVVGRLKAAA